MKLRLQGYMEGHEMGFKSVDVVAFYIADTLSGKVLSMYVNAKNGDILEATACDTGDVVGEDEVIE